MSWTFISDFLREYVQTLRGSHSALGTLPSVIEARGSCKRTDPTVGGFGTIMPDEKSEVLWPLIN